MLWSTEELRGMQLVALDGDVGHVRDLYFDDARWAVRYLVVRTGGWLGGRDVLLSPHSVERLDRQHGRVHLTLTRREIEASPSIDADKPVSRQQEASLHNHYGHPPYWTGSQLWGGVTLPLPMLGPLRRGRGADPGRKQRAAQQDAAGEGADPHLRSSAEVTGYALNATDGTFGRIEDFLFDERSWAIEHLVADTRRWWPGGEVVLPRSVVASVDWAAREVEVRASKQAVKDAPAWTRDLPTRDDSVLRVQRHFESSL